MGGPYRTLVEAPVLALHLGDPRWVAVDCRFSLGDPGLGEKLFGQSRIPGARYAHLERHLSSPATAATGRHPLPDPARFAATLAGWGITPDSQIVAYDDSFGSMAARLWWLLRPDRAGHEAGRHVGHQPYAHRLLC